MTQYVRKFKQMYIFYRKCHIENVFPFAIHKNKTRTFQTRKCNCLHNVGRLDEFFLMKINSKIAMFFMLTTQIMLHADI